MLTIHAFTGLAVTKVPERWQNTWENNLKFTHMAEDAGIDFAMPVGRWIGHGGATNFNGNVLECFTWAAGLAAVTSKINLVVTAHTSVNHPVAAAKQIATIDQISKGRISLNIVAGWNKPEYEALGLDLPATHEQRYAFAREWCQIVRAMWTNEDWFDWKGQFWHLKHTKAEPRPVPQPIIINAAGSGEGRDFATQHADVLFTVVLDLKKSQAEIADLKTKAQEAGRQIQVMNTSYVVCRPTEQEARDYVDYYVRDNADWEAADKVMNGLIANSKAFPPEIARKMREGIAAGHGSWPLTGTPRQVANGIIALKDAGFVGTTVSFVNYIDEFPYFRDEVLPLLVQAGIRRPVEGTDVAE